MRSIERPDPESVVARQVVCFFWTWFSVQPDWMYVRDPDDWMPAFINFRIREQFRSLCVEYGWSRFTWKSIVEECIGYGDGKRRQFAAGIEKRMLSTTVAVAANLNAINEEFQETARKEVEEEACTEDGERQISFTDD